MPEELLGGQATRVLFALFMATALTISALPVIARMLVELDLMRRNFGQITLAAATRSGRKGTVLDVDWSRSLGTHLGEVCPSSPHPGRFEDRPLSPLSPH